MIYAKKPPPYSEPGHCLILPAVRSDADGGIQLQTQLEGTRGPIVGWLSYTGLRQIAGRHRDLGLVPAEDLIDMTDRAEIAEAKLAEADQRIAELEENEARIVGLRRAGFTVQKSNAGKRPAGAKT